MVYEKQERYPINKAGLTKAVNGYAKEYSKLMGLSLDHLRVYLYDKKLKNKIQKEKAERWIEALNTPITVGKFTIKRIVKVKFEDIILIPKK